MTLRPCNAIQPDGKTCGATPALTETERYGIQIMRLECKCGQRGAALLYSKPEDRAKMQQAAEDGWNLSS